MAVLTDERTCVSNDLATPTSQGSPVRQPRPEEGRRALPPAWLTGAGEFALGLVLTLVGLLVRAVMAVCLLAAPLVALALFVLLFALLVDGAVLVLRAVGLMH